MGDIAFIILAVSYLVNLMIISKLNYELEQRDNVIAKANELAIRILKGGK